MQVPVLGFFVQAATAAKEAAMGVYVQQQLEYGKLWKLVEFSQVGCCQHALQRLPPQCQSQLLQRRSSACKGACGVQKIMTLLVLSASRRLCSAWKVCYAHRQSKI